MSTDMENNLSTHDIGLSRYFLMYCGVVDLLLWIPLYSFCSRLGHFFPLAAASIHIVVGSTSVTCFLYMS